MTKEQMKFLEKGLKKFDKPFRQSILELMDPHFSGSKESVQLDENFEDQFQKGIVDPAMQTYRENILPELEQRYADVGGGSSSALNQALLQSSKDLTSTLAGQRAGYQQQQQQYGLQKAQLGQQATQIRQQSQQMRANAQQGALQQVMNLMGQRAFQPIVQGPQEGLTKPLISAGGTALAGYFMSSEKVKENIRDYDKSLETIDKIKVKQYDYIPEIIAGNRKDRVGLIAEDLPKEITFEHENILHVDLYGLVSMLVNCVKDLNENINQLNKKVKDLEKK